LIIYLVYSIRHAKPPRWKLEDEIGRGCRIDERWRID
jgi:hypothetical protein